MSLINILKSKNVSVNELSEGGKYLRVKWELVFARNLSKKEKKAIYFDSFLWHMFSYEVVKCLEGEEAIEMFNRVIKQECFVIYQYEDNALELGNAIDISALDFSEESDVYIVDRDFTWTYVQTHEDDLGPYFYKLDD